MRLTLDALMVLDAVARRGSFAAAAEELHRVPSAVTYAVQKLEAELEVAPFDRSGHRAKLTEAGRLLLDDGRAVLAAAGAAEARVRRLATGWEAELVIGADGIVPPGRLFPLLGEFYATGAPTRIRLTTEILSGCWDALVSGRADIVIGTSGDGPPGGGYATTPLGEVEFVFAVAPHHPLAALPEPLAPADIQPHRAIAIADTARNLPPRSSGLLIGQDVLTVATAEAKVAAQEAGLGVGYLPRSLAAASIAAGRLVERRVLEPKPRVTLFAAWRPRDAGKAAEWWLERLRDEGVRRALLGT